MSFGSISDSQAQQTPWIQIVEDVRPWFSFGYWLHLFSRCQKHQQVWSFCVPFVCAAGPVWSAQPRYPGGVRKAYRHRPGQQSSAFRADQNYIHAVCIQFFWQGNYQIISVVWLQFWPTTKCRHIIRVGQNCKYTPYMIVYLMWFLQKLLYIHRIYMANCTYKLVRE
jgi:hypothetical protein